MVINQSGAFSKASKNHARSLAAAAHDYSTDAPLHKNPKFKSMQLGKIFQKIYLHIQESYFLYRKLAKLD